MADLSTETTVRTQRKEDKGKADTYIIGIFITLCIFSIIESYSASSREIYLSGNIYTPMIKHLILLGGAALILWAVQRIDYTRLLIPSILFAIVTVILMVFTMFFGDVINGAQRSFSVAGFTIQPAELAKIAIVFVLSFFLAQTCTRKKYPTKA